MITTAPIEDCAWEFLDNLGPCSIPEDLSEIDATWIFYTLSESGEAGVEEAALNLDRATLNGLAFDLRDIWHTARCEQLEWDRHGRYDYE